MEVTEFIDIDGIKVAIDRKLVSAPILGAMARKQYEHVEARLGMQVLSEASVPAGQILLEIGAGLGFVGSHLFRSGKIAKMHSYEANPQLIPLITETHRANNVISNIHHAMIDCRRTGSADFFVPADFWAASSKPNARAEKISCPKLAFAEVIASSGATFLMVDIEGGEKDLFSQVESLGTVERILIEIHQPMIGRAGVLAFFKDMVRLNFVYDQKFSTGKVLVLHRVDVAL